MLIVNRYKEVLLKEFYLDSDDITIKRATNGYYSRWKQNDIVFGYKMCSYGYEGIHIPRTRITVNKSHLLTLLRGIEIPDNSVIDHIDGNSTNNLRENIRITSQAVNCRNAKARVNNSTGLNGIVKDRSGKYIVRLTVNGIRKYLGYRDTIEDALLLRNSYNNVRIQDGYTNRHGK